MTTENRGLYEDYVFMLLYNNADLLPYWKAYVIIGRFAKAQIDFPLYFYMYLECFAWKTLL